jgi:hypothetical protein
MTPQKKMKKTAPESDSTGSHPQSSPHLVITLTGQAPVRILKADWDIIALGENWIGDTKTGAPTWSVAVRRHRDGRMIVYAISRAVSGVVRRAGEICDPSADAVDAIKGVAIECFLPGGGVFADLGLGPQACVEDCISGLPPVDLV